MVKLSAVIITFNEEANIGRCLDALEGVVDEVVVVDSYSSDRTPEICRERKVTLLQHPFKGHIQQKNYALEQATYDHVLSLDADEVLSERLKKSLLEVRSDWQHDGYYFNRLTNYCGQWIHHCGWYPDQKLRLWDRKKGQWGGQNPHDKVIMDGNATTAHLEGNLLHYSFNSISEHVATSNKFSDIVAQEVFKKGKQPSILVHLLLNPWFTFLKKYCLKGGFLDGYYGLIVCVVSAYYNFLKYAKARHLFRKSHQQ